MKKIFFALVGALLSLTGAARTVTTVSQPDWSRNAVIYEVNLRQYTDKGTMTAFRQHLYRLKKLGVDILWFMPIHPISEKNRKGELGSYYAVRDYKAVNPEFGTLEDFKSLVALAHKLGFKVIIDWVPNHTGCDHEWVKKHSDWYEKKDGKMFGPYDWTDVYKLNYSKKKMRAAMIDAMSFWITEADIDGFRCDVAGMVPVDFWNEAREKLQALKPDLFMLAEATEPELTEHCFNMAYNWPMKDLFSEISATSGFYRFVDAQGNVRKFDKKQAVDIYKRLEEEKRLYAEDTYLMNMITNHDLNSWEGTEFKRLGPLNEAFAVLTYTLPGMPLIYTGQEVGMDRALEFFVRDTPPNWDANQKTFRFYQTLNNLRHERKELLSGKAGRPVQYIQTASPNVLAFSRGDVLTIVNLGPKTEKLFDSPLNIRGMHDIFTGAKRIPETLPPGGYVVFVK